MAGNKYEHDLSAFLSTQLSNDMRGVRSSHEAHNGMSANERSRLLEKIHKLESLLDLYSELHGQSERAHHIPEEYNITREKFFENYYFLNRPVVLKGMMDHWPAMKKWSPKFFADQFGDVPVQLTANRNSDTEYEKNFLQTVTTRSLREFIDMIMQHPETNDLYIVARNYFFANPAFDALRDDMKPPADIIDISYKSAGSTKLWFGPKGTVTPLHHDKHTILFTQVYGSKHFKMIPSFELNKVYNRDKYYSRVDASNVDAERFPSFLKTSLADVIVKPGDMLLIPAGWWHWVKSLDVSISVTFSCFAIEGRNTEWKCS